MARECRGAGSSLINIETQFYKQYEKYIIGSRTKEWQDKIVRNTKQYFASQTLLHTNAFTHKSFYSQKLLHTEAFTHKRFYTQALLHTNTFTHRRFYT